MAADPRRGSVRIRTTAAAVGVVAVVLVIASVAMLMLLRRSLTRDVQVATQRRAEAVAALFSDVGSIQLDAIGEDDDEFIQIVDADGDVRSASRSVSNEGSFADRANESVEVRFDDDPFFVATAAASEGVTVVVGRTLDNVDESTVTVAGLLVAGVPLLLAIVAVITWRVVGSALGPVESIRAQVETISTDHLEMRVPVPNSADEIARLARTMNAMLERLQEGSERQRRFVSDASHELRSPVATIRQHAEVALAHPDASSVDDLAAIVLAEDLRLQQLVEDLLLLSRMDERGPDTGSVLDVDDVIFDEVARRDGNASVDIGGVSAGRVRGDRGAVARLVANLLDNACRHAVSRVAVGLSEEADEVVLRVDDDGPGINRGLRTRVFERFVRLEEARDRDSGGAGLGLAIVAEVAAHHGGTVAVLDSPLGGARLEVRLPRAE